MNPIAPSENLGEPAIKLAGFQLWVHGRQFPESDDYFDGNWLRVTAYCGSSGASIWVHGSILMVTDIEGFGSQCDAMYHGSSMSAVLDPLEPELRVELKASDNVGHIHMNVDITPDNLVQSHSMKFEIDQSYLPGIVSQCSAIVREYPIRGTEGRGHTRGID